MANVIQIKRKTTTGAPTLVSLAVGEFCLVLPDDKLYMKKDAGTMLEFAEVGSLGGGGDALVANGLDQFASTTLAELNGVLSDFNIVDNNAAIAANTAKISYTDSAAVAANTAKPDGATITAEIGAAIDALVGGAPGALDTLNELAAAMADDATFSATVTASLATKLDANSTIDGGTI